MKRGVRTIVVTGAIAITAAWVSANADSGRELLFSAPIQKLDRSTEILTVLGQSFHAQTAQMSIGEIVKVYGVLQKDGTVGDALVQGTNTFATNGDAVFLKGVVTNSDPALGHIEIDGLTVDYTSQLGNPQFSTPSTGDVIALSGLQPTNQGVLVASATGDAAYAVQSSTTGGFASVASQTLTGLANSASTTGTGAEAARMVGTGAEAARMVGTGAEAARMVGTGAEAARMVGTGAEAARMVGTGAQIARMVGTGAK